MEGRRTEEDREVSNVWKYVRASLKSRAIRSLAWPPPKPNTPASATSPQISVLLRWIQPKPTQRRHCAHERGRVLGLDKNTEMGLEAAAAPSLRWGGRALRRRGRQGCWLLVRGTACRCARRPVGRKRSYCSEHRDCMACGDRNQCAPTAAGEAHWAILATFELAIHILPFGNTDSALSESAELLHRPA